VVRVLVPLMAQDSKHMSHMWHFQADSQRSRGRMLRSHVAVKQQRATGVHLARA
jgi:hypothetical protein